MDRCCGQRSKPDIMQLSGQAQHTLKGTYINGVLEAESLINLDHIGLTDEQELPDKIPGKTPNNIL